MADFGKGIYEEDMSGQPAPHDTMNDAFGSASTTKGGLDSPETDFPGRAMAEGALADPANALPSAGGYKTPPEDEKVFDSLSDRSWKIA
jgi:hypothetical protein